MENDECEAAACIGLHVLQQQQLLHCNSALLMCYCDTIWAAEGLTAPVIQACPLKTVAAIHACCYAFAAKDAVAVAVFACMQRMSSVYLPAVSTFSAYCAKLNLQAALLKAMLQAE